MLEQALSTPSAVAVPAADIHDLVQKAIAELKPHLNRDGGDIELIAIDGDKVIVDMTGNCSGCMLASVTLAGVKKRLIEKVGRPLKVIPLSATTIRRPEPRQ